MKNYYDILEVSQKASKEVIEKAYKALVKKYHPDLQPPDKKKEAEDKIKIINEAYSILSDETKRAEFDRKLQIQQQREQNRNVNNKTSNRQTTNNQGYKQPNRNSKANSYNSAAPAPSSKKQIKTPHSTKQSQTPNGYDPFYQADLYNQQINKAYSDAYRDAYNQAFGNMGYQVNYREPRGLKYYLTLFAFIVIFIFVCFLLWHIPFVKNFFIDLYNNNEIFKTIIDIINNIISNFVGIFKNE